MPVNRHRALLEARVGLLQKLLRLKQAPEITYGCLQNIVAEGDGWSDWEDFIDHGCYSAIERHWQEKTLKALQRMGVEEIRFEDLKRLEQAVQEEPKVPRPISPREASL